MYADLKIRLEESIKALKENGLKTEWSEDGNEQ